MIFIENKEKVQKTLAKLYPSAEVIDVTSKGKAPFVRLSPFYPHGNIPVPFSINIFAYSVEGIWQGLKVFEQADIDTSKFEVQNMKGIKRTVRKYGKILGHRKGVRGTELLDYQSARKLIYLPAYTWLLENKTKIEIQLIIKIALKQDIVLLDFEINSEIENIKKPLSHASLIKNFIDNIYPSLRVKRFSEPVPPKTKNKEANIIKKVTKSKSQKNKFINNNDKDKTQLILDL